MTREEYKKSLKLASQVLIWATEEVEKRRPKDKVLVVASALDEIGRALKEKGFSLDEVMERTRQTRGAIIAEE